MPSKTLSQRVEADEISRTSPSNIGGGLISVSLPHPTIPDRWIPAFAKREDIAGATSFLPSIAALKSKDFSSYEDGSRIPVGGYYENGDGGGGEFLIREAEGDEITDDAITFLLDDGRVAQRLIKNATISTIEFGLSVTSDEDQTGVFQKALDWLGPGKTLVITEREEGFYKVSKNEGLTGFPGNDQPCLLLRGKSGFKVLGSLATIKCETHAQGILEIQECENFQIESLSVEGAGNFPGLDADTGRGEKGTSTQGYNTSGFQGSYKNNSYSTSANDGGGYDGQFPQWDGGTSGTWGEWNGGYIGNVAYGILIHNSCKKFKITRCKSTKFNFAGIGVGFNGDYVPDDLGYGISEDFVISECECVENYDSGITVLACDKYSIESNDISRNGHPDSNIDTDEWHDPGYGFAGRATNYSAPRNGIISKNRAHDNIRKGIDLHTGLGHSVDSNDVQGNWACGIFAAWSSGIQETRITKITSNFLDSNGAGSGSQGQIYVGGQTGGKHDADCIVSKNLLYNSACFGIRVRYAASVIVSENILKNSIYSRTSPLAYILFSGNSMEDPVMNGAISGNMIYGDDEYIIRGISVVNGHLISIHNNFPVQIMDDSALPIGINVTDGNLVSVHDNYVELGAAGTPYSLSQIGGGVSYNNQEAGGSLESYLNSTTRKNASLLNFVQFDITFNGTSAPDISNVIGTDIVGVCSSISTGLNVAFNGPRSTNTICHAHWNIRSADGLVSGANKVQYTYLRAISSKALEIGMKLLVTSGGHTTAESIDSGILRVTFSFG